MPEVVNQRLRSGVSSWSICHQRRDCHVFVSWPGTLISQSSLEAPTMIGGLASSYLRSLTSSWFHVSTVPSFPWLISIWHTSFKFVNVIIFSHCLAKDYTIRPRKQCKQMIRLPLRMEAIFEGVQYLDCRNDETPALDGCRFPQLEKNVKVLR